MMKKMYFAVLGAAAVLSLATACSTRNMNESSANESSRFSSESSANETDESNPMGDLKEDAKNMMEDAKDTILPSDGSLSGGSANAEHSSMTGTIHEIKDFMFTITADGTDYAFSFDQNQKPEGLSDVEDGDTVTVTYTGTVNEIDAFSGTVLSVKKAN